jgi:hypothetical protein
MRNLSGADDAWTNSSDKGFVSFEWKLLLLFPHDGFSHSAQIGQQMTYHFFLFSHFLERRHEKMISFGKTYSKKRFLSEKNLLNMGACLQKQARKEFLKQRRTMVATLTLSTVRIARPRSWTKKRATLTPYGTHTTVSATTKKLRRKLLQPGILRIGMNSAPEGSPEAQVMVLLMVEKSGAPDSSRLLLACTRCFGLIKLIENSMIHLELCFAEAAEAEQAAERFVA